MTFKGCTCNLCKSMAVGVASWSVVTFANHDQFCQEHRPTYCNLSRDVAHGPHNDPPIRWIRAIAPVIASTSRSTSVMITPDFFIRW